MFMRILALVAALCFFTGCVAVDDYSSRAIAYNLEAEQTGNQQLLLNILRAKLHRPLQFTDIQTITGAESASGSLGLSFPIAPGAISTGSAAGSLSGGTTFTVPVLNTQEFYQAILNPVQPQIVDFFLKAPDQRQMVFDLLFDRVTVKIADGPCAGRTHDANCERDFRNDPNDFINVALFETIENYLLNLQISSEALPDKPTKKADKPAHVDKADDAKDKKTDDTKDKKDASDAQPATPKFRICFNTRNPDRIHLILKSDFCGEPGAKATSSEGDVRAAGTVYFDPTLAEHMRGIIDNHQDLDDHGYRTSIAHFSGHWMTLSLRARSTYDVFRYLGAVANLSERGPVIGLSALPLDHPDLPCIERPDESCKPLLLLNQPGLATSLAFIVYAGSSYSIPGDPNSSYSPDVLALLKQLVGLNVSSKSLPSTAVLTLAQ